MRHAFEGTFPDHAGSFKMADDPTGYCKTPLDPDDLPKIFHDRALPLGCQTPADIQAEIAADDLSQTARGRSRADEINWKLFINTIIDTH